MRAWIGLAAVAGLLAGSAPVAQAVTRAAEPGAAEPGAAEQFAVRTVEYDLGDQAATLPGYDFKTEIRGKVYAPRHPVGRLPLVVFLHGFHEVCYGGDEEQRWPCAADQRAVPSFRGYDAPANDLASHGFVVVSISSNAVNRNVGKTIDAGTRARGELVLAHLDLLRQWSVTGSGPITVPIDFGRVGLMGHSRGGDGVVAATLLNAARPHPYGIKAVLPLASTDVYRTSLPGVAMNLLMGYCDGDVYDLQSQHFFDDSVHAAADRAPRSEVLVMGANHNFFNSEWTPGQSEAPSTDDWGFEPDRAPCGTSTPTRLTAVEQQAVGRTYIAGFFRWVLGGEDSLAALFDGSVANSKVKVVAQSPDRLDLPTIGTTSGQATASACTGSPPWFPDGHEPDLPYCANAGTPDRFPHWVPSQLTPTAPTPPVTALRWSGPGVVRLPVPKHDVRRFAALTFRATSDPASTAVPDLTVRVIDGSGRYDDVAVNQVSDALVPLLGDPENAQPKTVLRTVRIPLSSLRIDLRDVRSIELRTDQTPGAIYFTDVAFSTPSRGRTTINSLPQLTIADAPPVPESGKPTFIITLNRPSARPVTVHAEVSGFLHDPEIIPPYKIDLTFAPGQTRQTIQIPIHPNTTTNPTQSFRVALSIPHNAITTRPVAAGTVLDDDTAASNTVVVQRRTFPTLCGLNCRGTF